MRKGRVEFLLFSWLMVVLAGCAGTPGKSGESSSPAAKPPMPPKAIPVITQSFASSQIAPGKNWKVYLKASDADGDMKEIAATVQQPGVGTYPVSFTRIAEKYRQELSGYVYLIVPLLDGLDNLGMTVTIQIRDRSGLSSQPLNFPLSIGFLAQQELPPPGVFEENDLGPILVDLHPIPGGGPGGPFRFRR
jgi:hypothetical protein